MHFSDSLGCSQLTVGIHLQSSSTTYRPDIDCLRAFAVLSVVGYVFFVISGFLIAHIIHSEAEAGLFSLVGLYERRVRRILPALITADGSIALDRSGSESTPPR
jgi:peptidoglycan/LPS O-acetylase OafA/YrhL